jgi:hypothetical protein
LIFSHIYRENKAILYNYWLIRYCNFEEIIKRISRMVEELLIHNPLIDSNEPIRVLKLDNSKQLSPFSHAKLKRYIMNE